MGSTFFRLMDMDPLGPSGLASCFYPLQLPPSPHLIRRFCARGSTGVTVKIMLTVRCSWGRRLDTYINGDKFELGWRLWILSGRWHNQYGDSPNFIADGDKNLRRVVYGAWRCQVYRSLTSCRGIKGTRHVSLVKWLVSRIEVPLRLPCTPPIKTSIPFLISFAFRRNCIVKVSPSPVRAYSFNSFRINFSPLTFFLGKWFHPFTLFYFQLLWQKLKFLVSVSPFYFKPVSLRFCHYV